MHITPSAIYASRLEITITITLLIHPSIQYHTTHLLRSAKLSKNQNLRTKQHDATSWIHNSANTSPIIPIAPTNMLALSLPKARTSTAAAPPMKGSEVELGPTAVDTTVVGSP